jgi:hypothetical protein
VSQRDASESAPAKLELGELWAEIFRFFRSHGYIRRPRRDRVQQAPAPDAWEVRFFLDSPAQVRELQALLAQGNYRFGKPYRKYGKYLLPLQGQETVELIEELWQHAALLPGSQDGAGQQGQTEGENRREP